MVRVKENMEGWNMWEHGVPESRLTVIKQIEDYIEPNGQHYAKYLCKCRCGSNKDVNATASSIKHGHVKSCGCLQKEAASKCFTKENIYDLESKDYAIGYTQKNEEFWFDKNDYELVRSFTGWFYDKKGYVCTKDPNSKRNIKLHRVIMGIDDSKIIVDHKNHPPGNQHKYDNRKSNLRIATMSTNSMNIGIRSNNTSGVTGVYWNKTNEVWEAKIQINKKRVHLGSFNNKEDAIIARKNAELKYYGEYRYSANN